MNRDAVLIDFRFEERLGAMDTEHPTGRRNAVIVNVPVTPPSNSMATT